MSDWEIILLLNWKSKENKERAVKQKHVIDPGSISIIKPGGNISLCLKKMSYFMKNFNQFDSTLRC